MEPINPYFCIESDGTVDGTKITGPDGQIIGLVQSVKIDIDCQKKFVTATMTLLNIPLRLLIDRANITLDSPMALSEDKENA